jgi:hypothetical protein
MLALMATALVALLASSSKSRRICDDLRAQLTPRRLVHSAGNKMSSDYARNNVRWLNGLGVPSALLVNSVSDLKDAHIMHDVAL